MHMRAERSRLGTLVLLATLVLTSGGQVGCSAVDCESVSCSTPQVIVRWLTGQVPSDAQFELCADDVCETVQPTLDTYDEVRVATDAPLHGDQIRVAFTVTTADGSVTRAGRGKLTGSCCGALLLWVDDDRLRR